MGVVIESSVWQPNPSIFLFLLLSSFLSILLLPYFSKNNRTLTSLDHGVSSSFLRFQRFFFFLYTLSSVMEGTWSAYGEFELAYYGVTKEDMVLHLCIGFVASLVIGSCLGMLSDMMGQKKICLLFCILHLSVGIWKKITMSPSIWLANICLSLASSIFSFNFETWVVVEHEKQGQRNDSLSDTFWLMTFFESASLIGTTALVNWLVGSDVGNGISASCTASIFLAIIGIISIVYTWKGSLQTLAFKEYCVAFYLYILGDKRNLLLGLSQACLHFSVAVFWILWAPTLVADGRGVYLGLIYPCLLGSRMLGSTVFPWVTGGPLSLRIEDFLLYTFTFLGLILSIIAYDYQEIGFLVTLFCLIHVCVGLVLPLLARLRTVYVPNELRGGMLSLSLAPANAAILFFLIQRGYYGNIENSTLMALAAVGLFVAAGCMYLLKRCGKQLHQDWHKL